MRENCIGDRGHPDDIEIGCGGLLLSLHKKGYSIVHIIATNGEEGDLHASKDKLAKIRRAEAQRSAERIGSAEPIYLDIPDGATSFDKESKVRLIGHVRKIKPDIILTHAADDHFPDHQMVRALTLSAVQAAAGPWYPEGGSNPHQVKTILGFEVWNPINKPQLFVDISHTMAEKLAALEEHRSQTQAVNYLGAVEGLAKYRGATSMTGTYAEAFEVISIDISGI